MNAPSNLCISEFDERLIQRCLDDELTSKETRQLLSRLDSVPDGWKTLACGFVEERLFKKAIRGTLQAGALDSDRPVSGSLSKSNSSPGEMSGYSILEQPSGQPLSNPRDSKESANTANTTSASEGNVVPAPHGLSMHWWSHPLTSLSLCAAIAFVAGLLVPDLHRGNTSRLPSGSNGLSTAVGMTAGQDGLIERDSSSMTPAGRTGSPAGNYSLQIVDGAGSKDSSFAIPVVNDPVEWSRSLPLNQRHIEQLSPAWHGMNDGESNESFQLIRISVDDKNDILMFVRDSQFFDPAQ